jgi:hypothetical protein
MAISRGAGTEIIRSILLEELDNSAKPLIIGVQHHIYTILSIIVKVEAIQAANNWVKCYLTGYDASAGTSAQDFVIFHQDMQLNQTFIWNDKWSFNGFEPTDFTGPTDDATKQDAIADQGSSVAQKLYIYTEHADDNFDVTCTYIDQNNA